MVHQSKCSKLYPDFETLSFNLIIKCIFVNELFCCPLVLTLHASLLFLLVLVELLLDVSFSLRSVKCLSIYLIDAQPSAMQLFKLHTDTQQTICSLTLKCSIVQLCSRIKAALPHGSFAHFKQTVLLSDQDVLGDTWNQNIASCHPRLCNFLSLILFNQTIAI